MLLLEVDASQLIFRVAIILLTVIVLLTLASQFGRYLYLELATHFRLQYVVAAGACALVFLTFQSWKFLPIAILTGAFNAIYLLPFYKYRSNSHRDAANGFRLLHANVLKNNNRYRAVFNLVDDSKADMVVFQEVDEKWGSQLGEMERDYPYSKIAARPEGAGMAIFSRYSFKTLDLLNLDASTHVGILASIQVDGKPLTVLAIHPPTPMTPFKFENRNRQFSEAAILLNSIDGPKILVGDLNTTPWSPHFLQLTKDAKLRDSRLGSGLLTSWPTPLPAFLRMPIDHCLVSRDVHVRTVRLGAHIGSDHLPLLVDLEI